MSESIGINGYHFDPGHPIVLIAEVSANRKCNHDRGVHLFPGEGHRQDGRA